MHVAEMFGIPAYVLIVLAAVFVVLVAGSWSIRLIGTRRAGRAYLRRSHVETGLIDGALAGAPLLEAAAAINPHVINALGRLKIHSTNAHTILQHFQGDHAALVSDHFIDQLKGYVAESIAADHFAALGHHVVLATTTNQPGWDLLIDGHPYQVKAGATAFHHGAAHLQAHADIPVITDPSAASQLVAIDPGSAISLHELGSAKLEATTAGTVHGIDTIAHAGAVHFPIVTVAFSSYKEIKLLADGNTEFSTALAHVAIDAAGVGIGMAAGAKGGAALGGFAGLHGAAIGGFIGGVAGGIAGKVIATFGKEAHLRKLREKYQMQVRVASASFRIEQGGVRARFLKDARRFDRTRTTAIRKYASDLRRTQRRQATALRMNRTAVLCEAWLARRVRLVDVRDAVDSLRSGNREPLLRVIAIAEGAGATRLLRQLRTTVALMYQLEHDFSAGVLEYDRVQRSADLDAQQAAAAVLEHLAQRASAIFAECEGLRVEINAELGKLGKPLPALPPP